MTFCSKSLVAGRNDKEHRKIRRQKKRRIVEESEAKNLNLLSTPQLDPSKQYEIIGVRQKKKKKKKKKKAKVPITLPPPPRLPPLPTPTKENLKQSVTEHICTYRDQLLELYAPENIDKRGDFIQPMLKKQLHRYISQSLPKLFEQETVEPKPSQNTFPELTYMQARIATLKAMKKILDENKAEQEKIPENVEKEIKEVLKRDVKPWATPEAEVQAFAKLKEQCREEERLAEEKRRNKTMEEALQLKSLFEKPSPAPEESPLPFKPREPFSYEEWRPLCEECEEFGWDFEQLRDGFNAVAFEKRLPIQAFTDLSIC